MQIEQLLISSFPDCFSKTHRAAAQLELVLDWIKDGNTLDKNIIKIVEKIRACKSKTERVTLKKTLPAFTFSGTFNQRNNEGLQDYTGILCADIDGIELEYAQSLKLEMANDKNVLAAFISPSGGLKVLFFSTLGVQHHGLCFDIVKLHIKNRYNAVIDEACKDVVRLCYTSYDPTILVNFDAAPILINADHALKLVKGTKPPKATLEVHTNALPNPNKIINTIHKTVSKNVTAAPGTYNSYINLFAIEAKKHDLTVNECADGIAQMCGWPGANKEDLAIINSVYNNAKFEQGKYKKNTNNGAKVPGNIKAKTNSNATNESGNYDTSVMFWYLQETTNKNTGEVKEEYKYSYDAGIKFLENNGFYKYRMDNNGYRLVHVDKTRHIVEPINELRIKEFILDFLKTENTEEFNKVREMFRRGIKNYLSGSVLDGLSYHTAEFLRDDKHTSYVFFKNVFVRVTAGTTAALPYTQMQGYIWKKQIIDFDYTPTAEFAMCDYNVFVQRAITGFKPEADFLKECPEVELQKYNSVCTSIGYLLHSFKDPGNPKAIVAVDKKVRTGFGTANGGSGKSLFSKAIGQMLPMVILDGSNFKFDYEHAFQMVSIDTALINFNDVKPTFDFSRLFGMITEEITINPKGGTSYSLPFSESPKFYISTNYTLKGDGDSAKRRQQIMEFSNWYCDSRQPYDDFGRMFFLEWDNAEWNMFYNYMVSCVAQYLQEGLIHFPLENYELNKLYDSMGEDIVDYFNDNILLKIDTQREHNKHDIFMAVTSMPGKDKVKMASVTKYLKEWASVANLGYNLHKQGERDKRNNIDWCTFTKLDTFVEPGAAAETSVNDIEPAKVLTENDFM
jgi:VirE N-terminal domain